MWFFLSSPMITLDTHYLLKLLRGNYKKISKIFYKTNNIKTEEKQQPAYLCLLKDQSIKNTKYDPPNYLMNALGWQIINLLNADTWTCYTWKWRFWKSCLLIPLNLQKTMNADVKPFSKNARTNFLDCMWTLPELCFHIYQMKISIFPWYPHQWWFLLCNCLQLCTIQMNMR